MAEKVSGINPAMLKWARDRSGYTLGDVARSFNKAVSAIEEWESGGDTPTYVQLEKLGNKYKRPIAIFFFPDPPEEHNIAESLALRSIEIERLSPRVRLLLRQAKAMQLSLIELNGGVNPAEKQIFRDVQGQLNNDPANLAQQARRYLGISVEDQTRWKSAKEALENWRDCVQDNGIFVFKDAFKQKEIDGFCLVDDEFPIIYLNNTPPEVRQIFSLFHELAHLLLGGNGMTIQRISNINSADDDLQQVEVFCNRFASEFLVPSHDFETYRHIASFDYDDEVIENLANHYKVSRHVILLKFLNTGIVTQGYYERKVRQWTVEYEASTSKEEKTDDRGQGGGNFYNSLATYLGYKFLNLAFSKYHQDQCTTEQLADYLNVKVKHLPELEDRLFRKATT